ncbi:MAG: hypothetical protein FH749_13615 [Firmicutes bacterium]|nr:hypothetical protein [Bacillota bacterium]
MKFVSIIIVLLLTVNLLGGCMSAPEETRPDASVADIGNEPNGNELPAAELVFRPKARPQLPEYPDVTRKPDAETSDNGLGPKNPPPSDSAPAPDAPPENPEPAPNPEEPKEETGGLSQQEKQMLELVNAERAKVGVAPLKLNMEVTEVARVKSKDMLENNYFEHQSPVYGSPFEMLSTFGINFSTAGENIALYHDVTAAHQGLMNSPGHRENILREEFSQLGIGIIKAADGRLYITQLFIG